MRSFGIPRHLFHRRIQKLCTFQRLVIVLSIGNVFIEVSPKCHVVRVEMPDQVGHLVDDIGGANETAVRRLLGHTVAVFAFVIGHFQAVLVVNVRGELNVGLACEVFTLDAIEIAIFGPCNGRIS